MSGADGVRLTLDEADAVVAAALAAARAEDARVTVAVVDAGGHLLALRRDNGAGFLTVEAAERKAWSAAASGLATMTLNTLVADAEVAPLAATGRLMPVAGGVPLRRGNALVGALGVSGGTAEQDHRLALAGMAALC